MCSVHNIFIYMLWISLYTFNFYDCITEKIKKVIYFHIQQLCYKPSTSVRTCPCRLLHMITLDLKSSSDCAYIISLANAKLVVCQSPQPRVLQNYQRDLPPMSSLSTLSPWKSFQIASRYLTEKYHINTDQSRPNDLMKSNEPWPPKGLLASAGAC